MLSLRLLGQTSRGAERQTISMILHVAQICKCTNTKCSMYQLWILRLEIPVHNAEGKTQKTTTTAATTATTTTKNNINRDGRAETDSPAKAAFRQPALRKLLCPSVWEIFHLFGSKAHVFMYVKGFLYLGLKGLAISRTGTRMVPWSRHFVNAALTPTTASPQKNLQIGKCSRL